MKIQNINSNINFSHKIITEKDKDEAQELIDNSPFEFEEDDFLAVANGFKGSPIYNLSQYVGGYIYFKNLEDSNGDYLIKTDGSDLINSIKNILDVDTSSLDTSYIELAIDLNHKGLLNDDFMRKVDKNFTINDNLKKDIDLYCDVVSENKDKNKLNEELLDSYIKNVSSIDEGISKTSIGDAFKVDNEDYIRIKTSDNSSELMNISKENYSKLFPMFDRFAVCQENLADCFLLETLEMMYFNPKERVNLIKMFSQDDKGNIYIDFNGVKTKFKNGQLPKSEIKENHPKGAKGFSLLEYAYGSAKKAELTDLMRKFLKEDPKQLKNFEEFLKTHKNDAFLDIKHAKDEGFEVYYGTIEEAERDNKFEGNLVERNNLKTNCNTFIEYLIGNGGATDEIQYTLGYDISYIHDDTANELFTSALLKSKSYMDKHFVTANINEHLYGIELKENSKGELEYYLYNPYRQAIPAKVSLDEIFEKNPHSIIFSQIKE